MTQAQKVIEHLKRYGSITQLEATEKYGIIRLSGVVFEINRKHNECIYCIREECLNRYGERTRYGRYYLAKGANV